jgi:hypothetical protein
MPPKKPRIDEHQHQSDLFTWVDLNMNRYPELRFFHAIPNGAKLPYTRRADGTRFSRQAVFLKREGLRSGVPDTCLPVARYVYHGLYIEMKAEDGKPTEEQVAFLNFLNEQGFLACLCYGSQAAITVLEWYLDLPRYLKPDIHINTPAEAVIPDPPAKPDYIDLFSQD